MISKALSVWSLSLEPLSSPNMKIAMDSPTYVLHGNSCMTTATWQQLHDSQLTSLAVTRSQKQIFKGLFQGYPDVNLLLVVVVVVVVVV